MWKRPTKKLNVWHYYWNCCFINTYIDKLVFVLIDPTKIEEPKLIFSRIQINLYLSVYISEGIVDANPETLAEFSKKSSTRKHKDFCYKWDIYALILPTVPVGKYKNLGCPWSIEYSKHKTK